MPINYPIKFEPILKERIWGGEKLHTLLGKDSKNFPIGESWEISTLPNNISIVANGELKGKNLQELIETYKDEFLGKDVFKKYGTNFPLLIKFIDAEDDLSVQLHPNDEFAHARHNSFGKEEMWYIMQADKDSKLFLGFNQKLSKETFRRQLKEEKLTDILNTVTVKKDDVYNIPTGCVHTIGKGILLAEIQQASDITYRLYDWNRKDKDGKGRELHTELAINALDFDNINNSKVSYTIKDNTYIPVYSGHYFSTKILHLTTKKQVKTSSKDSFTIYMCVEGKGVFFTDSQEVSIQKGECILIPASFPKYSIVPESELRLLYVKAQ